jgi:SAM-dependent methyltransferase
VFTGRDISEEAIEVARFQAGRWRLGNVTFDVEDAAAMNETRRYDLITAFDTIHDQARPTTVLQAIADGLRPGGVFLMQDIAASSRIEGNLDNPIGPTLYAFSLMHCMPVSLSAGGEGLGAVWGEETARRMLERAGFVAVRVEGIEEDKVNSYYIATR